MRLVGVISILITGGHDCGFDGRRAPIRMDGFDESNNTGHMRARHGSSRHDSKRNSPLIIGKLCRASGHCVGSKHIHSWCCDIRLIQITKITKQSTAMKNRIWLI